jgi:hypothetical protein
MQAADPITRTGSWPRLSCALSHIRGPPAGAGLPNGAPSAGWLRRARQAASPGRPPACVRASAAARPAYKTKGPTLVQNVGPSGEYSRQRPTLPRRSARQRAAQPALPHALRTCVAAARPGYRRKARNQMSDCGPVRILPAATYSAAFARRAPAGQAHPPPPLRGYGEAGCQPRSAPCVRKCVSRRAAGVQNERPATRRSGCGPLRILPAATYAPTRRRSRQAEA